MGWMSAICDAHKKKVVVELLYNSVHRKFRPVGDQISWREDAGMRNMSQRGWAPRPPIEQPRRTGKKRCCGHKSGGNMLQFCSVSNSLSHTTFSIKWEVYFSKELCRSSLLCRRYDSAYRCICIVWLYKRTCSVSPSLTLHCAPLKCDSKKKGDTVLIHDWIVFHGTCAVSPSVKFFCTLLKCDTNKVDTVVRREFKSRELFSITLPHASLPIFEVLS